MNWIVADFKLTNEIEPRWCIFRLACNKRNDDTCWIHG